MFGVKNAYVLFTIITMMVIREKALYTCVSPKSCPFMNIQDLQSVIFSTGNAHTNARFPSELTATLQPKLLLKSVTLVLKSVTLIFRFSSWSSIFLGDLHHSETCSRLQEHLQVWLVHRNHVVIMLENYLTVRAPWLGQSSRAGRPWSTSWCPCPGKWKILHASVAGKTWKCASSTFEKFWLRAPCKYGNRGCYSVLTGKQVGWEVI